MTPKDQRSAGAMVALVEDNPDNRLLVETLLADRFEVVSYENGLAALEGFGHRVPDVVLLDISMPGMDGPQVLARMRAAPELAGVPAIALTAHAMSGDREKFIEAGFDDYIAKPILDDRELIAAIHGLLSTRR